ncbi:MAG: sulfite exporter TauE/SafE family protein [Thermoleophilia bacterium]|nr:sulfite exporter TauE/SafE family protein [Thermoleophilia bacterium]
MSDTAYLLITFAIILGASFIQGATTFGFALVAMPLLLLLMPTADAVALSLALGSVLNLFMVRIERDHIAWREIGWLIPAATIGAVAGMLLLKNFDGPLFKAFIALTFLAMTVLMLTKHSWKAGAGHWLRQSTGLLSGLLNGATSMGGPPVVLYLTGRGLTKERLRGTLAMFFLLGNLAALAAFLAGGLFNAAIAGNTLFLATAVIPGSLAGRALTSKLDPGSFRRLVLVSMGILAVMEIALNLTAL